MKKRLKSIPLSYYFLFFLIGQLLLVLSLGYEKSRDEKNFSDRIIGNRSNEYRAILSSYDRLVDLAFEEVINKPEITSILHDSYLLDKSGRQANRERLYKKLLPSYQKLIKSIVRQVQFHFADGTSFLRMHKPKEFGDKLFDVRASIRIANIEKRDVDGFEEGRHYHAFRHVYPLFSQGKHVGSVGLSVPFYIFKRGLVDAFPAEYFFIIKKSVVESKLFPKAYNNYQPSTLSAEFLVEKADLARQSCKGKGHKNCLNNRLIETIDQEIKENVTGQLATEKPFVKWTSINGKYYVATFIPVENVEGEIVGYLYSYFSDSSLPALWEGYFVTYGIATTLIIFLLCLYRWSTNTIVGQNRFLHTTIESIPYPFYVIDAKDHSILLANSLAGSSGDWLGKTCHQLTHNNESPCDGNDHICPLQEVINSKKSVVVEHLHRDSSGAEKFVEVYGSPIFDQENNVIQMIEYSVDITERKLAETVQQKLEYNLRQAQKSEAIGTMAGGFAHHFNNILSSVLGFADLAQSEVDEGSQAYRDMGQVVTSANRAKELVRHIMTLTGQEKSSDDRCMPAKIFLSFLNAGDFKVADNICIEQNIDSSSNEIALSYYHLTKIINILVTNAVEAMNDGGTLGVIVKDIALHGAGSPESLDGEADKFVNLAVSDTGRGIPKKDQDRIFDPFFTTKDVGQGEGIGLAILQGIVVRSGGRIKVTSEVGKGTRFDIFMPIVCRNTSTQTLKK